MFIQVCSSRDQIQLYSSHFCTLDETFELGSSEEIIRAWSMQMVMGLSQSGRGRTSLIHNSGARNSQLVILSPASENPSQFRGFSHDFNDPPLCKRPVPSLVTLPPHAALQAGTRNIRLSSGYINNKLN